MKVTKTIVLVGMMGVGKTRVGRLLASALELPFNDSDHEIEKTARCSVSDLFERFGEQAFRDGEKRVILRLLDEPVHILATGAGAFMNKETRQSIASKGLSIWLKADHETISERVKPNQRRPLLVGNDMEAVIDKLIQERYPIYKQADIIVETSNCTAEQTVEKVLDALETYFSDSK